MSETWVGGLEFRQNLCWERTRAKQSSPEVKFLQVVGGFFPSLVTCPSGEESPGTFLLGHWLLAIKCLEGACRRPRKLLPLGVDQVAKGMPGTLTRARVCLLLPCHLSPLLQARRMQVPAVSLLARPQERAFF